LWDNLCKTYTPGAATITNRETQTYFGKSIQQELPLVKEQEYKQWIGRKYHKCETLLLGVIQLGNYNLQCSLKTMMSTGNLGPSTKQEHTLCAADLYLQESLFMVVIPLLVVVYGTEL
jgi:hypothetical protein